MQKFSIHDIIEQMKMGIYYSWQLLECANVRNITCIECRFNCSNAELPLLQWGQKMNIPVYVELVHQLFDWINGDSSSSNIALNDILRNGAVMDAIELLRSFLSEGLYHVQLPELLSSIHRYFDRGYQMDDAGKLYALNLTNHYFDMESKAFQKYSTSEIIEQIYSGLYYSWQTFLCTYVDSKACIECGSICGRVDLPFLQWGDEFGFPVYTELVFYVLNVLDTGHVSLNITLKNIFSNASSSNAIELIGKYVTK